MKPINFSELVTTTLDNDGATLTANDKKILRRSNVLDFLQGVLDKEIEERTAQELETRRQAPAFNVETAPHPSEYFLPKAKLEEAEKRFDQCGEIEINIRRTLAAVHVNVRELAETMKLATAEDEARAERVPLSAIPRPGALQEGGTIQVPGAPELPKMREGEEQPLPAPPQGSTIPPPRAKMDPTGRPNPVPLGPEQQQPELFKPAQMPPPKPLGLPVYIGLPTQGIFLSSAAYSIFGQLKRCLGPLKITKNIDIRHARNIITHEFLKSEMEWLYMQDSDIIAPFGSVGLYRDLVGERALSIQPDHLGLVAAEALIQSGKTLVGGVYSTRNNKREIVCNMGMKPRNEDQREIMEKTRRTGPKAGVLQADWIGFGCVVIHKQVFLDILKNPEFASLRKGDGPVDFFDFTGGGEDVTFCQRAAKVGHPPYLNTAVWCAHVGDCAYLP